MLFVSAVPSVLTTLMLPAVVKSTLLALSIGYVWLVPSIASTMRLEAEAVCAASATAARKTIFLIDLLIIN